MPAGGLLLIASLAGLWLAGRALAERVTADRRLASFLSPGLGAACWLILVHLTGRWTGSFRTGLEVGTVVVGAIGVVGWLAQSLSRKWECEAPAELRTPKIPARQEPRPPENDPSRTGSQSRS